MFQIWRDLYGAIAPYVKIIEYAIIFATIALAIFAARRLRSSTREMRSALESAVDNAVARLRAQSQEAVGDLETAGTATIARMRAMLAESVGAKDGEDIDKGEEAVATEERGDNAASDADRRAQRKAHDEWWQSVVDMKFSNPDQAAPRLHWKNNVRAPMPWRGTWLTGWRNDSGDGVCGVALSGTGKSIDAFWRRIRSQAAELKDELPEGSTVEQGRFGIGIVRPNSEFRSDDERRAWIAMNLDRFATALGPRMKAPVHG